MRRKATYLLAITQHQEPASAGFFLLKIIQSRMTAYGRFLPVTAEYLNVRSLTTMASRAALPHLLLRASKAGVGFLRPGFLMSWHMDQVGTYVIPGREDQQLRTYLPMMSADEQRDYVVRNLEDFKL